MDRSKEKNDFATPPGRVPATSAEANSASCRPMEIHDVISPSSHLGGVRQLEGSVASDFDTCTLHPDTFSSPMLPDREKDVLVLDGSPLPTMDRSGPSNATCFSPQKFAGDVVTAVPVEVTKK